MSGNIHRQKKNRDFVTIDTHCLRNRSLKWDAKGLHSYLMQLPDDWNVNLVDLQSRGLDKHDGTMSPMRALIAAGYVYRERVSGEKGRFVGYDYHLFERPEHAAEWLTVNGKTIDGKTVNGKTVNGKTPTSKVLSYSKNEEQQQQSENDAAADFDTFSIEIFEAPKLETVEVKKEKSPSIPGGSPSPEWAQPSATGPYRYQPFDLAKEIEAIRGDFRMQEGFVKLANVPIQFFGDYLDTFQLKAGSTEGVYNNRKEVRDHFYNWARKRYRSESAQKAAAPTQQAGTIPSNIRRF